MELTKSEADRIHTPVGLEIGADRLGDRPLDNGRCRARHENRRLGCTRCRDFSAQRRGTKVFVTGLVLAAGASRRLGEPKQLLPFKGTTLLGATLETARDCGFEQTLVTVGGSWSELREQVDFGDFQVVENEQFESGCSSSISAAIAMVGSPC